MSEWRLFKVMVLKEIRTTFRERSQLRGLLVALVVICMSLGGVMTQMRAEARRANAASHPATTMVAPISHQERDTMRWLGIAATAGLGFFFSLGYLISAVLSSFVGEKEGRTLEILLASPLSDRKLFFLKCVSVLIPSALLGLFFAGIGALLAWLLVPIPIPPGLFAYGLLLGPPLMLLGMLCFVGLGAAISAKAETMKGAAQALSAILMIVIFGGTYGLPILLKNYPPAQDAMRRLLARSMQVSFASQYGMALLVAGAAAAICLGLARMAFRRDRMLA